MDEKLGGVRVTDSEQPREQDRSDSTSWVATPASGWETRPRTMARKKVSTTVYIEPEQADRLKVLHERTKVPVAVYIREGIELALAKYEHLLPGQLTLEQPRKAPPAAAAASHSTAAPSGPAPSAASTGHGHGHGTGTGG